MSNDDVNTLRRAIRTLDIGVHYCRYCSAQSPKWKHGHFCPYALSVKEYEAAMQIIGNIKVDE